MIGMQLHYFGRHLGFLISGFMWQCYIEMFDPENMGIDTRIIFLSRQIAELLGAIHVTNSVRLSDG